MAIKKPLVIGEQVPVRTSKAGDTLEFPSSSSTGSSIRIPPGTAPSSPANGDVWALNDGLYVRYNNQTIGPLGDGSITVPGGAGRILFSDGNGTMSVDTGFLFQVSGTTRDLTLTGSTLSSDRSNSNGVVNLSLTAQTDWFGVLGTSVALSFDTTLGGTAALTLKQPRNFQVQLLLDDAHPTKLTLEYAGDVHKVWHEGSDGAGSGLDADLLDGQQGTFYLNASNMNSGTLAIDRGGTGATTVAAARNNLGLGNTSGAVPIANGGTGATSAANARSNLGLGTAATYNVPTSGDAASNQVVLGNDSRLSGGASVPGSNTQVIFNNAGSFGASPNMTFDGTLFKAYEAQAKLAEQIINVNTTLSSSTVPNLNRVIKKTTNSVVSYTINTTLGSNGDTLTIINAGSSGNLNILTSGVTIYSGGMALTNVALPARSILTLYRASSTIWIC